MKGFVCKRCGYIAIDGKKPARCPVCQSPDFEEQENAIHQAGDVTGYGETEKKHVPAITVIKTCGLIEGCRDVHVKIGSVIHPMLPEHHILYIDFYLNKQFIARSEFRPDKVHPAAVVHLKQDAQGALTAVERCNLHGAWIAEATV